MSPALRTMPPTRGLSRTSIPLLVNAFTSRYASSSFESIYEMIQYLLPSSLSCSSHQLPAPLKKGEKTTIRIHYRYNRRRPVVDVVVDYHSHMLKKQHDSQVWWHSVVRTRTNRWWQGSYSTSYSLSRPAANRATSSVASLRLHPMPSYLVSHSASLPRHSRCQGSLLRQHRCSRPTRCHRQWSSKVQRTRGTCASMWS